MRVQEKAKMLHVIYDENKFNRNRVLCHDARHEDRANWITALCQR